jgi:MFS family permease
MTRNYYLLLCAYFISSIGDWLYQLALPLLVYQLTHSPLSMAVTYGLTYLPYMIFLPLGGLIADRVDRRRLLMIGDFTSALVAGVLVVVVWSGAGPTWVIYPLVFILAGVTPLYHPAFQSVIPNVVEDAQLARANAWLQGSENIVALVGPLVSGLFIVALGTISALFLDALSFLVSALLIVAIRLQVPRAQAGAQTSSSWAGALREGFDFVWHYPLLRYGALLFFGTNFGLAVFQANYIYFLSVTLGFTPAQIGLSFTIIGIGAILGALIAPALVRRFEAGRLILGSSLLASFVMLPLLVARDIFTISIPWAIVTGLTTINAVTWFTMRQRVTPQRLLGRVVALTRLIGFASIPIGAFVGGVLLDTLRNMHIIIIFIVITSMAVSVAGYLTPLYRQARQRQLEAVAESQGS